MVTGIGLVSSLGIGTEANWAGVRAGRSGVGAITKFDTTHFATRIAGEVKNFDPLAYVEKKDVKKMDIFIQYAIAASQHAMDDSGLTITPELSRRVGVFIASGIGGFTTIEREHKALLEGGPRKIRPFSSRPRSSTWPRARCRSGSAPGDRTPRPAPPARPRRTRSATRSRSSNAAAPR
jgi:3-oxoacyl-[acyl-carrier-protein] synthase II